MNLTRCAATMATFTILTVTSGCAVRAGAPFHIYGSPTLQGDHDAHAQETSHRRVVAATRDAEPRATPRSPRRAVARASREAPSSAPERVPARSPDRSPERDDSPTAGAATEPPSLPSLSVARLEREPTSQAGETPSSAASYVWSELEARGVELGAKAKGSVPALYRACAKEAKVNFKASRLKPGHVAFFHNTFDANDDERNNDWYTHAALVMDTDGRGRATLVAYQDGAVREIAMNLGAPGGEGNDQLRPRRDDDAPFTRYMSGELFAGACAIVTEDGPLSPNLGWRP